MRERGHTISFMSTRGGPLEEGMQRAGVAWTRITDTWDTTRGTAHSEPVDPSQYDAILVNTIVMHPWLRAQVEAWGLAFMRKVVWWVHELEYGLTAPFFVAGDVVQRALLVRTPAVVFDSEASRSFWEKWVLEEAEWLGLDFSPLIGRWFSFERNPPLPAELPTLRTLRLPRPDWMAPFLGEQPECSRASSHWPHAELRRQFRARINASDADCVVLFVGTTTPPKGAGGALRAFVRAWQAAAATPAAARGGLLLLGVGHGMPDLRAEIEAQWAAVQAAGGTSWPAALPDAVHLLEASGNAMERFGWYAAGDVQVVNSECENYGLVTVEGSAASLPLLGTACGGTQEIIADGLTGLLHPPPSAGEASDATLADHILLFDRRTHEGRLLAANMGTAGCRRMLSGFAPSTFYAAMEATLQQVAANASAADAAASGPEAPPPKGLPLDAGMALPSGWAGAFMPEPRMQGRVKAENMSWEWRELEPAPAVHFEGLAFKINGSFYLRGGYSGANDIVLPSLWRMDLNTLKWVDTNVTTVPDDMPETHQAAVLLGNRHLYLIGGQKGPACSPGSRKVYRLDMHTRLFHALPPLPEPSYFPTAAFYASRLHVFGGLGADRYHPAYSRWSIGLHPNGSTDGGWRVEQPSLPEGLGGSHTTTIWMHPRFSAKPRLYVWGRTSQEYTPENAAAGNFRCVVHREWADSAMWSFEEQDGWRRHRDLPLPVQHTSMCTLKLGQDAVLIVGGQHYDRWLSRTIWVFNATEDSWTHVGNTPVYGKGSICALHAGRLVVSGGQFGLENGANPVFGTPAARQFAATLPPRLAAAAAEPPGALCGLQC